MVPVTGFLAWLLWPSENFGVVAPDAAYRCAQPGTNLTGLLAAHKPASILNLRGGTPANSWYVAEVDASQRNRIAFYDLPLSATRRPTRRELRILIDILETCPLPVLIHCKSGADRTGLASALFLLVRQGQAPEQALGAFSLRYGHVPLFGPERLHEPIAEYAEWLEANQLAHTPGRFRDWVIQEYRADDPPGELKKLPTGPRVRMASGDDRLR